VPDKAAQGAISQIRATSQSIGAPDEDAHGGCALQTPAESLCTRVHDKPGSLRPGPCLRAGHGSASVTALPVGRPRASVRSDPGRPHTAAGLSVPLVPRRRRLRIELIRVLLFRHVPARLGVLAGPAGACGRDSDLGPRAARSRL
jgi:hypothetical protein